jgi:hypothetical protein
MPRVLPRQAEKFCDVALLPRDIPAARRKERERRPVHPMFAGNRRILALFVFAHP